MLKSARCDAWLTFIWSTSFPECRPMTLQPSLNSTPSGTGFEWWFILTPCITMNGRSRPFASGRASSRRWTSSSADCRRGSRLSALSAGRNWAGEHEPGRKRDFVLRTRRAISRKLALGVRVPALRKTCCEGRGGPSCFGRVRKIKSLDQPFSQIRSFYSLLGWLPKLDLVTVWIFDPRKAPVARILLSLFDGHAFTLEVGEYLSYILHPIINLSGSRLILDVLIRGHNRPRQGSLDLWIFKIPRFKRCVD